MYITEAQKALIRKEMVLQYQILLIDKRDYKRWIATYWKDADPSVPKYMTQSDSVNVYSYSYIAFLNMNKYKNELRKVNRKIRNVQAILKELK